MKSFTLFLLASTITTTTVTAINEPIASPTTTTSSAKKSIQNELDLYERELGTGIPGNPTLNPGRPTVTVSFLDCLCAMLLCAVLCCVELCAAVCCFGRRPRGVRTATAGVGSLEFDINGRHLFLHVMWCRPWCAYDGGTNGCRREELDIPDMRRRPGRAKG